MAAAPLPRSEPRVLLRPITPARLDACLALTLAEHQRGWVAPNVYSQVDKDSGALLAFRTA